MTDDELKALVASLAVAQKATDEQMKRTDEQMKRTDEKLERMGISLGNVTNNQGNVAEEFWYLVLFRVCGIRSSNDFRRDH